MKPSRQNAGRIDHGSEITAQAGRDKFIDTQKQEGTDAEQRADARTVYEGIIGGSGVQGAGAAWGRIRNRFRWPDTA
jgi:hypothetical protein